MCIAIYKPSKKTISKDILKRCYDSNPDGAGFMYADKKELKVHKGFFEFDKFYQAYQEHQAKKCVIHFRIKTHGKVDETNCHPFLINPTLGFVHNGIISGFGNDTYSDTIQFNEAILQKLVGKWGNLSLFQDPIVNLIERSIGWSKLIMLDRHGNHKIFNEEKGEWNDGVWYSNSSYKPAPKYPIQTSLNYDWRNYSKNTKQLTHSTESIAQSVFKEGDQCQVIKPIKDFATGSVIDVGEWVEIVGCNKDGSVDIVTDTDDPTKPFVFYNVSTTKLMLDEYAEYWD